MKPCMMGRKAGNGASFPPRSCGGLIEAMKIYYAAFNAGCLSPRVRAGASLKRRGAGTGPRRFRRFPPAFVRGPH